MNHYIGPLHFISASHQILVTRHPKKSPLDLDINRSANSVFNSIKYECTFDDL